MPTWTADAADYATGAPFVPRLAGPLLELAGDVTGLRVLDLGCGDGTLTAELSAAGADVLGVDADASMVAATRARGLEAVQADARDLAELEGSFDLVLSNAVLHWIAEVDEVVAAVARVLRPGGRFVLEAGGHGNVAAVRLALRVALDAHGHGNVDVPDWRFPTAEQQAGVLQAGGFTVESCVLAGRPTPLPNDITDWLRTFAGAALQELGADQQAVLDETRRLLAPVLRDDRGRWTADYVRVRAAAILPIARGA